MNIEREFEVRILVGSVGCFAQARTLRAARILRAAQARSRATLRRVAISELSLRASALCERGNLSFGTEYEIASPKCGSQ